MTRVLVAGATGYLGRYVVREFEGRGARVRALARDPGRLKTPGPALEPAVDALVDEVFVGDVTRPETLRGVCDGVDVVVSSVGLTRRDGGRSYEEVDHRGNANLLGLAAGAAVRKFVFVHVFNDERLQALDVVRAKRAFVDDLRGSGLNYAVVRPTGFFNDMAEFLYMARRGAVYQIGDGSARINPIHGADLARVCVDAAFGPQSDVPVGGPDTFTYRRIAELAFEALGAPPRIRHVPAWLVNGLASALRLVSRRYGTLAAGLTQVVQTDNVAPSFGTHYLADFFRELAPTLQKS